MKIPLHMSQNGTRTAKDAQAKIIEQDILKTKKGDWNAKNDLIRIFRPLLKSLAEKRANETPEINKLMESGKDGLVKAAKKYKVGSGNFQLFALDFIETAMDNSGKKKGFFASLFG